MLRSIPWDVWVAAAIAAAVALARVFGPGPGIFILSVLACVHILLSKALAVSAINEEVSLKFCPKQLKRNARNSYAGQRYQLSLAPCLIQLRMLLRSQLDNCFLLCGMRNSGAARQSSNNIKLLLSGSRGNHAAEFRALISPA